MEHACLVNSQNHKISANIISSANLLFWMVEIDQMSIEMGCCLELGWELLHHPFLPEQLLEPHGFILAALSLVRLGYRLNVELG